MSDSVLLLNQEELVDRKSEVLPLPSAVVRGVPLEQLPLDLYVPPDALRVFLESFEGPLDLLLYLIERQNIDVLDIPIAEITRQYLRYIELMKGLHLDLASEYLVMSAELTEIKSRILLPLPPEADPTKKADPRVKLMRQLQEYARYKKAAQDLNTLSQLGRDVFSVTVELPDIPKELIIPPLTLSSLLAVMREVMERAALFSSHHVICEPLSVRERMSSVLERLRTANDIDFANLFTPQEGRAGVVVTLLAILELTKESLIRITQTQPLGRIQVTVLQENMQSS